MGTAFETQAGNVEFQAGQGATDSSLPSFAGISSVTPNDDGSFSLSWALASGTKTPIEYELYVAPGTLTASALFAAQTYVSKIEKAGKTSGKLFLLADGSTYFVKGNTYTFGVLAKDSFGYRSNIGPVLTSVATASGNLPAILQTIASSLIVTDGNLQTDHANFQTDHSNFQADHAAFQADIADLANIYLDLVSVHSDLSAQVALMTTEVVNMTNNNSDMDGYLTTFAADLVTLANNLSTLQSRLNDLASENADFAASNSTYSGLNSSFTSSLNDLDQSITDLQAIVAGLQLAVSGTLGANGIFMEAQSGSVVMSVRSVGSEVTI